MRLMDGLPLYVVSRDSDSPEHVWELQGVFDTEEAAKAACRDDTYCYFLVKLNESVPHETIVRDDAIFPKAGAQTV